MFSTMWQNEKSKIYFKYWNKIRTYETKQASLLNSIIFMGFFFEYLTLSQNHLAKSYILKLYSKHICYRTYPESDASRINLIFTEFAYFAQDVSKSYTFHSIELQLILHSDIAFNINKYILLLQLHVLSHNLTRGLYWRLTISRVRAG